MIPKNHVIFAGDRGIMNLKSQNQKEIEMKVRSEQAVVIKDPKTELIKKANSMYEQAKALVIKTAQDLERAADFRKMIKDLRAQVNAAFDPIIESNKKALAVAKEQKDLSDSPLVMADNAIKFQIQTYQTEQQRIRQAEEDRIRKIAQDKARAEAEERRKAEEIRLFEQGKTEQALDLMEKPVEVKQAQVHIPKPVEQKVTGANIRILWSAELMDLRTLAVAVVNGEAPIQCLQADMVFLNKQATAFKGELKIPGVRPVSKSSVY